MSPRAHTTLTVPALALTALLAACGTTTTPQTTPTTQDAVLTVLQPGNTTTAQLEAQYHGTLITRTPTFALLKVNGATARLSALGSKTRLDKNEKVFHGELRGNANLGSVNASGFTGYWASGFTGYWASGFTGYWASGFTGYWASGFTGYWANGFTGYWANGSYAIHPQNTTSWHQIALDDAHVHHHAAGAGSTVAVIDTGVDLNHMAFQVLLTDPSTWHDFVDGDALPQDEGQLGTGLAGHGTEVAGIVAQVSPGAKLMPLRVLGADGTGDVASVAAAIVWAVDHGANVINLSLGSGEPVAAVSQAIAYANSKGVAVAAAVGNSGQEGLDYPAAEFASQPMNLSVGSVTSGDVRSAFSRYGSGLEILAPGEAVYGPAPQDRLAAWSGTSMSAPEVAGALAISMGVGATAEQAAAALTGTATPLDAIQGNEEYAGKLGSGRLNLDAALTALGH